jgi:glycosyltransferase involved in cell wall biosynthesis
MKVSIVTVVFNNKALIQGAIDSVKDQDYPDVEHIIIDGQSTDGTLEVIKKNQHVKWISEPDEGLYDAMNKGVRLATGALIGLLNSDDLFKDHHVISRVVQKFREDNSLDAVFGNLEYVKRDNPKLKIRTWITGAYHHRFFEEGLVPPHPTLYLKRQVYQDHLFDLRYKLAADYEFMLRVFKTPNYRVGYVNDVFITMRMGGETNKSVKNIVNQNVEIYNAWKTNGYPIPTLFWMKRIVFKLKQFIK